MRFGNYPNMGHCVIENTASSINQLLEGFNEIESAAQASQFVEDLNEYEQRAWRRLYELAEELAQEVSRVSELSEKTN